MRSIVSRLVRAAAPLPPSPRTSARLASGLTPATPSGAPLRTRAWWASARRWASPAETVSCDRDIGGPMARNVADAVAIFDVIAGYDPADPVTAASQGERAESYVAFLDKDGVRGKRLGVVRQLFTPQNTDPEVMKRMEQALIDLGQLGAKIV